MKDESSLESKSTGGCCRKLKGRGRKRVDCCGSGSRPVARDCEGKLLVKR